MEEEYDELGMDMLFVMVTGSDQSLQYVGYYGEDEEFTEQVADEAFDALAEKKDGYYLLDPSVSRKRVIVPALDEACSSMEAAPRE